MKIPGSQFGTSSANHSNNAASGSKICRTQKLKLKFSHAIRAKIVSQKIRRCKYLEANWSQPRATKSEIRNPQIRNPHRFLRKCRSRSSFRRARNFEIRPRRKPFPRLRRPRPQSRQLSQAARSRISPLRNPVFSRPPRIRRASPARRTHPQRAPHDYFRLAAKRFVRRAQGRILLRATKLKLTGWKMPRWNSAGAEKNGARPLPDEISNGLRQKILPPFENFSEQLAKLKFQPNGKQLAEIFRELWDDLKVEHNFKTGVTKFPPIQRFNHSTIHATSTQPFSSK